MACTYILYSQKTKKYYVGASGQDDAKSRLKAHNQGKTKSTKFGRPWILVWQKQFDCFEAAREQEVFLKSGQGRKWIRQNIDLHGEVAESG